MKRIHVSQGHQKSVSMEVYLKSLLLLEQKQRDKFVLYSNKDFVNKTLEQLKIGKLNLNIVEINDDGHSSPSMRSLKAAHQSIKEGDLLLTMPTTKEELVDGVKQYSGHTDYFRSHYKNQHVVMLFSSEKLHLALLTEHINLSSVEPKITSTLISNKIKTLIESPFSFTRFIFSGINPHCGEGGIIGTSDKIIVEAINELESQYKSIEFLGPISGDILFQNPHAFQKGTCLIAAQHDQGLAPYKAISGLRATNISLGLPFMRLSPDHGTAFDIYGKDKANYLGTFFTMKKALVHI